MLDKLASDIGYTVIGLGFMFIFSYIWVSGGNFVATKLDEHKQNKQNKKLAELEATFDSAFSQELKSQRYFNYISQHINAIRGINKEPIEHSADLDCNHLRIKYYKAIYYYPRTQTIEGNINKSFQSVNRQPYDGVKIMVFDNVPHWESEEAIVSRLTEIYKSNFKTNYINSGMRK